MNKIYRWRGNGLNESFTFTALAETVEQAKEVVVSKISNKEILAIVKDVLVSTQPAIYDKPDAFFENKGLTYLP